MSSKPRFYDFGPFRLDLTDHILLRDGKTVSLTPKAFDTLVVLVRNKGRILSKDELLKTVWPEKFVEEATLSQNIFTLRKALGGSEDKQYIQTIPKRGYRFVASVTEVISGSDDEVPVAQFDTVVHSRGDGAVARDAAIGSLAVLPLINATSDPDAEYVSDGITENIVNTLSLLPELQIKACSTVTHYKGREISPQEAGCELAVDAVLIGRILKFGESLLIRMELVDVANGWQLWGEEYDQTLSDIHQFQGAVARDISEKLRLKLTSEEWQRILKPRAQKAEAYQLYLKGRHFLNLRTRSGYEKARDCFEQAIQIDPSFALAHCGLADSYILFDFYGLIAPRHTMPKARAAAVKAVELDNELPETHTTLAAIKLVYNRDPTGAEREFKVALRLNPKYSRAHDGYAHCLLEMGRIEESLAECHRALELEPFDVEINQHLGWYYLFARQYELAIEQLLKTLEMGPHVYRARILLGMAYVQKKLFSQAIEEFLRADQLEKTPVLSGFLGHAYAMARKKEALEILNDLLEQSKRRYVPPYSIALIYTGLGKRDEAFEWLQKAFVEHSHWHGWLRLTPELDSLRSDPRFTELVHHKFKAAD